MKEENHPTSITSNKESLVKKLNSDQLLILYAISVNPGISTASVTKLIGWHRATSSKYLKLFAEQALIESQVKRGTESKYRPTLLFYPIKGLSPESLETVAMRVGFDIKKIYQDALGEVESTTGYIKLPGGLPAFDHGWSQEAQEDWLAIYRALMEAESNPPEVKQIIERK